MKLLRPALVLALAAAGPAAAGETRCWWDQGRLVVGASVMGVTGDYLLDTGEPRTILAETHAQKSGFEETALLGEVKVAGIAVRDLAIAVQDFDARSYRLPTPIAGVIGLDVLKGYVVDVTGVGVCKVRLSAAGRAPAFRVRASLPINWAGERPTIPAAVADGPNIVQGAFVPSTAADAPIRVSEARAHAEGAARPDAVQLYGDLRPTLRALSLSGELFESVPAGLVKPEEVSGADGMIGGMILTRWSLRFDFPAGRLLLGDQPKEKGPRLRRP